MTTKERNLKLAQKTVRLLQNEDSYLGDILAKILLPGEDVEKFSAHEELVAFYEALPTNPKESELGSIGTETQYNAIGIMRFMRDKMNFVFDGYSRKEVEAFCLASVKKVNSPEINGAVKWCDAFNDVDFATMDANVWDSLGLLVDKVIEAYGTKDEQETQEKIEKMVLSQWGLSLKDLTYWERELFISNILAEYGYGEFLSHSKESL